VASSKTQEPAARFSESFLERSMFDALSRTLGLRASGRSLGLVSLGLKFFGNLIVDSQSLL
jgi:hypothetical protein